MPNFAAWLDLYVTVTQNRAADAWQRINDKPASIVLVRNGTALAAQTVRVEYDRGASEMGDAGQSSNRGVVVFGVRGHAALSDTDIQRGDRFVYEGAQFRVVDVVYTTGEVQAMCEAQR